MSSSEFLPGEWYLMVDCHYCHARYALFHDLTRGQTQLRATYCWTCPDCKRKDEYDADQLERYQHPTRLS